MINNNQNLATVVAAILRQRGNKDIKSIFWNQKDQSLSVFPRKGDSFNYSPDPDKTNEQIADYIAGRCEQNNAE